MGKGGSFYVEEEEEGVGSVATSEERVAAGSHHFRSVSRIFRPFRYRYQRRGNTFPIFILNDTTVSIPPVGVNRSAMLCSIPVLLCLLIAAAASSDLGDILGDVDTFFDGITGSIQEIQRETEKFKLLMRRSYDLGDGEHPLEKRSLDEKTLLIRDKKGVSFIKNITPFAAVPVKFPTDIQIVSGEGDILYVAALESNQDLPRSRLANQLVLYRVQEGGSVVEVARTETSGGYRIAHHSFENVTYVLVSEHEADNEKPFEGSTLYSLVESGGSATLEKIQILNISHPRDVKFWKHQNQMYLAVGTGDASGSGKSYALIFKWIPHNFDFIQKIEGNDVKSVTPFVIGSFMYLALANHQDHYGKTNIDSEIYRYHLQSGKFTLFQRLRSAAAHDISHFKFSDSESQKEDHFLAVANFFEVDDSGSLNYRTDSFIYKYDEDHFAPFQKFRLYGLLQWLPVTGSGGEFLLLALCSYTVLGFQYDGWRFAQIHLDYGQPSFGKNIVSVRSFLHKDNIYLSFADKNSDGSGANLWKVNFEHKNVLEREYDKVEKWCWNMMSKVEADNLDAKVMELHSRIQQSSNPGSSVDKLHLKTANIGTMETEIFDVYDRTLIGDVNRLNDRVKAHEKALKDLRQKVENENFMVYYDITGVENIPYLKLDCHKESCCSFENLNIGTLNGADFLSFINNAVALNEDIFGSRLEFEDLHLIHDLSPLEINGHPAETLIDTQSDLFLNSELVVDGTVVVEGDLQVPVDHVGDLKTEDDLLWESFRNFDGDIQVDSARVKNLEISGKLNGVNLTKLLQNSTFHLRDTYDKLNVNNLNINGSLFFSVNSTSFEDWFHVRGGGFHDLEQDVIELDEIYVASNVVSGVPLSDLMQTTAGKSYEKSGTLIFTQPELEFGLLEVRNSVQGEDSPEESHGEVAVIVEGFASLNDIFDPSETRSVSEILDAGVLLNSSILGGKLEFNQIKIDDVTLVEVNGIPVSSWVVADSEEVQVVGGKKTFVGAVIAEKNLVVKEVNGVNLQELFDDTLFLDGDQTVTAENITFGEIVASRAKSDSVLISGKYETLQPDRVRIFGSVQLEKVTADNVTVHGLVDGLSWDEVLQDSVFNDNDLITGKKTVEGVLDVRRIHVSGMINSIPVKEFLEGKQEKEELTEVEVPGDLRLDSTLHARDFYFEGSLDSVEKSRFGKEWLLSEGQQRIQAPMVFADVELKNGASLENETINNVNLKALFRDSIKVNETVHVKHLAANNIETKEISVKGTVNGAKFRESVLLAKSDSAQIIRGDWFLQQDLAVNGSLTVDGYVSGVNVTHLCLKNGTGADEVNLIVGGSVVFDEEPIIRYDVNGVNLGEVRQEIWMKNENVILEGQLKFCYAELHGNSTLKGLLNGMDLEDVHQNYMSKTRKKIVSGNVSVRNLVIRKSCRIRNATVTGNVNGIKLESWTKSVLMQDEDQIITGRHHFSEFAAGDIASNGTVNGLDLAKDVLRRDVHDALVTGEKTFLSLSVRNLTMLEEKKIQGICVEEWDRKAVKTKGTFTLHGKLTLKNPVFHRGLNVSGKVNGVIYDSNHVLIKTGNQTITGKKTFDLENYPEQSLTVNHLVAREGISGVDVASLVENQAFPNGDLVFTGSKSFSQVVITGYMTVKGLVYNENITEMCHDLATPPRLQNLTDKYEELSAEARIIRENFKEEPFFLDHYKSLQTLSDDVFAILPFSFEASGTHDGVISVITATELRLMEWDPFSEHFLYKEDEVLTLADNVTFATSGFTESGAFLYMEILNVSKIFASERRIQLGVSGTSCVAPFHLPSLNKECFFIGREWNESTIFCSSSVVNDLQNYQTLHTLGTLQASTLRVGEDIYLTVINKEKMVDRMENFLTVYKYDRDLQSFYVSSTLPETNPVAVSTITYKHHHFLVLAGGHLPESVDSSIVTIFRLNRENDAFVRYQSLSVDTPVDVHFAMLPTSELVLYVLSSNPTKPFIVFLYRGIRGFVEETCGPSLYVGSGVDSFTDSAGRHFVLINGFGRGQILQAGFKGNAAVATP